MKQNIDDLDRTIRVMVSILFFTAGIYFESYWGLLGLFPLATGLLAWCPLYAAVKVATQRQHTVLNDGLRR